MSVMFSGEMFGGGANMRKYMCVFLYADFVYIFVYLIFYVHSNEL